GHDGGVGEFVVVGGGKAADLAMHEVRRAQFTDALTRLGAEVIDGQAADASLAVEEPFGEFEQLILGRKVNHQVILRGTECFEKEALAENFGVQIGRGENKRLELEGLGGTFVFGHGGDGQFADGGGGDVGAAAVGDDVDV